MLSCSQNMLNDWQRNAWQCVSILCDFALFLVARTSWLMLSFALSNTLDFCGWVIQLRRLRSYVSLTITQWSSPHKISDICADLLNVLDAWGQITQLGASVCKYRWWFHDGLRHFADHLTTVVSYWQNVLNFGLASTMQGVSTNHDFAVVFFHTDHLKRALSCSQNVRISAYVSKKISSWSLLLGSITEVLSSSQKMRMLLLCESMSGPTGCKDRSWSCHGFWLFVTRTKWPSCAHNIWNMGTGPLGTSGSEYHPTYAFGCVLVVLNNWLMCFDSG
jgi:hypothetical protein